MAYVAARGGEQAIQQAEQLFQRLNGSCDPAFVQQLSCHLPYLIDRVMGEASLYAPELAALALAQTGGDLYEAVLLLRAYRSTQPRLAYSEPINAATTLTVRRISAAFKDIPGGQLLGPTLDYSHRMLNFGLLDGSNSNHVPLPEAEPGPAQEGELAPTTGAALPPVADWLRLNGLVAPAQEAEPSNPADLPDVTRDPIRFPAPRAHRLQSLARADTGGVLALGYAGMRGYGLTHPTVNELRLGLAELRLRHPVSGVSFCAGRIRVSQAEIVSNRAEDFELGFAATLGWNEVKVIAAAMLDLEMDQPAPHPAHSEEFVLYHTEPVEASGFCIHYKLPHYVTFSSALDNVRRVQAAAPAQDAEEAE
jgi:alpha-D-ribose 1-methylphosphonate 5-triphosphate synthase subunit PhnI